MYKSAEKLGKPRGSYVEAEFRAYHLMTLLAQHGKFSASRLLFYTALQASVPPHLEPFSPNLGQTVSVNPGCTSCILILDGLSCT